MDHVKGVQVDLDTKLATVEVEAPNLIDAMNMLPSFVKAIKVGAERRLHRLRCATNHTAGDVSNLKFAAGKVSARDVQLCASSPCLCTPLNCVLLPPACLPASVHCCHAHRSLGLRRSHTLSTRPDAPKSDDAGNRVRSCVGRTQQRVVIVGGDNGCA